MPVPFCVLPATRSLPFLPVTVSSSEKSLSTGRLSSGIHEFLKLPPCAGELASELEVSANPVVSQ